MSHSDHVSRMEFKFEGQFLGFVRQDGSLKYVRLRVESEEMQVKIPKAIRTAIGTTLHPGDPIQVVGIGKLDHDAHLLKLKATEIIPLSKISLSEPCAPSVPILADPEFPVAIVPEVACRSVLSRATESQGKSKRNSKIKVLVCQKSGCLKKGGKGLCEALNQVLCERNLNQHVTIERSGCVKRCSDAPNVVIMPGKHRYTEVRSKTLPQIADTIAQSITNYVN